MGPVMSLNRLDFSNVHLTNIYPRGARGVSAPHPRSLLMRWDPRRGSQGSRQAFAADSVSREAQGAEAGPCGTSIR